METDELHRIFLSCQKVSTDTRKITNNSLFFALKGDRFDANTFAAQALEAGAAFVVIDNPAYFIDHRTILVKDVLTALQELATFHRQYLNIPVIGLTGSNGKTTTKELINAVLSAKFNTCATVGNLNNHIGVPLTLLSFNSETEIGIVEMGANHQKEIEFLSNIALPDYGYITNFGKAHLEGFGGVEGVIKGKSELYAHLKKHDKTAIVNLDDPIQKERTEDLRKITYSTQKAADVVFRDITATPFVTTTFDNTTITSQLIGLYNANNIHAAITLGLHFGIENDLIRTAIEGYVPDNNRSQIIRKGSNEIILDAYNANPSSMAAALQNFQQLKRKKKTAILGDMFELGAESLAEHGSIVSLLHQSDVTYLLVGKDFNLHKSVYPNISFFETFDELRAYILENPVHDTTLLIKGSRGMALERLMEVIH